MEASCGRFGTCVLACARQDYPCGGDHFAMFKLIYIERSDYVISCGEDNEDISAIDFSMFR